MRSLRLRALSLFGFAVLSASVAAQQVLVVATAAGPDVDFTTLSAAVAAAADGDVILVQPGAYAGPVTISDRSLTIVGLAGPAGERVRLGPMKVIGLQAGKSVNLRSVDVSLLGSTSLDVIDCAGPVLVEDMTVLSTPLFNSVWVHVDGSAKVVFTRCSITGAQSDGVGVAAPPGVGITDSTVTFYDSSVIGGAGKDAIFVFGSFPSGSSNGGPAVRASNSTVLTAGTALTGGRGGHGITNPFPQGGCLPPGSGGAGVEIGGGLLRRLDADITGGLPGTNAGCGPDGVAGPDLVPSGGAVLITIPETLRTLSVSSPIEEGGTCQVEVHGASGTSVVLLQSLSPLGSFLGGLKGTLAGAPPFVSYVLGPLDGTGSLVFSVGIPVNILPPGIEGVLFIDQLVDSASSGGGLLSSPSSLVLVDALP